LRVLRAECAAFLPGRAPEAVNLADGLLAEDAACADAVHVRGLGLLYRGGEGELDRAISHFQAALRMAPDHTKAKSAYKRAKLLKAKREEGANLFRSGEAAKAYDAYTEALAVDTRNEAVNSRIFTNRAIVAAKLKRYKDSVEDCTRALALDPHSQKALLRRAQSRAEMGEWEEAVRDWEQALRRDRGNAEIKRALHRARGEVKKAKRRERDYYAILGVAKDATEEDIKKAYRKRALVHHPGNEG